MTPSISIDCLTASQRQAVLHKDGPLLVLAGPGSGKTRVITCRIAQLIDSGVRPWNICAITFTNKAAEEMRLRVERSTPASGVYLSTFHSLCVWILRRYPEEAQVKANFSIFDAGDQQRCMKEAIKDSKLEAASFSPARMLEYVSRLKNELEDVEDFESRAHDYFTKNAAQVYRRYQKILKLNNALDFDDLLVRTAFLLRDHPEVRQSLSHRFHYLLIDEYQDTNRAQYQIAKGIALAHHNICVTGDPDQAIYRWRGADIGNILAFEKDWPETVVVKLEENFRSTPNILGKADQLIAFNTRRKQKKLIATRPAGQDIEIQTCDDENAEARYVAEQAQAMIEKKIDPNEIAVFYRVNSMSRAIEEAFVQRQLPYQVVRGIEFYARKEVRDLLSYLKLMANPEDNVAFDRAIGTHSRGIGKTSIERLEEFARIQGISLLSAALRAEQVETINRPTRLRLKEFAQMIAQFQQKVQGPTAPLMEEVFTASGLAGAFGSDEDAIENIDSLISAAAAYDRRVEQPNLTDYLQMVSLYSDSDAYDSSSGRVSLMSLHAAKGLEFDHVFIVGLEDGVLPHERSIEAGPEDMEEERRLLFVGMTRARKTLGISYARHRVIRGQFIRSTPSQFLYEIGFAGESRAVQSEQWDSGSDQYMYEPQDVPSVKTSIPYRVDELVEHSKFGMGRIKEILDLGEDSIVVVKFLSGNTKSLMLKYANLRKVGVKEQ
ncbi:MAG: UvrD-helicase domain-containing protein [Planctomycetaceae bacterium]|nr:UvrD-helicase domain-containing protein [Planctomycetaceae bacterium]